MDRTSASSRAQLPAAQLMLKRSRLLTSNIDKGKTQSENFLATYFSRRRYTFSTIFGRDLSSAAACRRRKRHNVEFILNAIRT